MPVRHFLTLTDLSTDELKRLLARASVLKSMQHRPIIFCREDIGRKSTEAICLL